MIRMSGWVVLLRSGLGSGNSLGVVQAHVSRLALFNYLVAVAGLK